MNGIETVLFALDKLIIMNAKYSPAQLIQERTHGKNMSLIF